MGDPDTQGNSKLDYPSDQRHGCPSWYPGKLRQPWGSLIVCNLEVQHGGLHHGVYHGGKDGDSEISWGSDISNDPGLAK